MGTFIKRNRAFLYWVLIPSLLLVASVFGVNLVSLPVVSFYGSINCQSDAECNADKNPCVQEICNSTDPSSFQGFCDIVGYGGGQCLDCNAKCGNGRCEEIAAEDSITCSLDCLKGNGGTGLVNSPVCTPGVLCGADLVISNTIVTSSSPSLDGCCPVDCQGSNSLDSLTFDGDCLPPCCGDGIFDSVGGETCGEPNAPACPTGQFCGTNTCTCFPNCRINGQLDDIDGDSIIDEACDPQAVPDGCVTGEVCDQTCTCVPAPPNCGNGTIDAGEQCEPPNTATCDATCQTIVPPQPVCGDGVLDSGEECEGTTCSATINGEAIPGVCEACLCFPECQAEGSGCGDDGSSNTGVCFTGTGGTGAGSSLIPVGVHTGVLAQWLAAFAVPGAAFVGVKVRRRFKK